MVGLLFQLESRGLPPRPARLGGCQVAEGKWGGRVLTSVCLAGPGASQEESDVEDLIPSQLVLGK